MAKMAEGFKAVRMAEMELKGDYVDERDAPMLRHFNWLLFTDDEWKLCPPVVSMGGDGAMYDIGFQNLSRLMMSGKPIKVLVVDTQVYSNTGGQACTSGFIGQVSDMAPYGSALHGKTEARKEISLIGMAHRTAFVMQGTVAHATKLLDGFIDGLNSRRPALFNVYAVCPPEHGVGDDKSVDQSKLAVESRAYPLFRFDPDAGTTFAQCVSLAGNPAPSADWPSYKLKYLDENGQPQRMDLPVTFADFAATEARFAKHFRKAPQETWNDAMIPLAELIALPAAQRTGRFPYIWAVDAQQHLIRLLVAEELVRATEERLAYWRQLRDLVERPKPGANEAEVAERVRRDLLDKIGATLGWNGAAAAAAAPAAEPAPKPAPKAAAPAAIAYEPVWVETPECSACDECTTLAPSVFAYNDQRKAVVTNPKGASFADLVRAAEKCTAGCLHPGTPWNPAEPGLDGLQARAAKFN